MAKEFETLMEEIRGFVARRNDIAHGMVGGFRKSHFSSYGPQSYFLSPPHYNTKKYPRSRDGKPRTIFESAMYHYTADDIDYYRQHFMDLRKKILKFLTDGEKILSYDRSREQERAAREQERAARSRRRP